jgi:hypothetical protein
MISLSANSFGGYSRRFADKKRAVTRNRHSLKAASQ